MNTHTPGRWEIHRSEAALAAHLEGKFFVMLHEPTRRVINAAEEENLIDELPAMPWPEPVDGGPELQDILDAAAAVHGMPLGFMTNGEKFKQQVYARWVYGEIARGLGYSMAEIGKLYRAHHTTVLHGLRVARRKHPHFHEQVDRAVAYLRTKYPNWRAI